MSTHFREVNSNSTWISPGTIYRYVHKKDRTLIVLQGNNVWEQGDILKQYISNVQVKLNFDRSTKS